MATTTIVIRSPAGVDYAGFINAFDDISAQTAAQTPVSSTSFTLNLGGTKTATFSGTFNPGFFGTLATASGPITRIDIYDNGVLQADAVGMTFTIEEIRSALLAGGTALQDILLDDAFNFTGNGGSDIFVGGYEADTVRGGAGNDGLSGFEGADYIEGGDGDDYLDGGNGIDRLLGGAGNDTLVGGEGVETYLSGGVTRGGLIGGAGNDVYINPLSVEITEVAGQGFDRVISDSSFSLATLTYVERLELTGSVPGFLRGNNVANQLIGNAGSNTMSGFDGDDALFGGGGRDTIIGGMGRDQIAPGLERDTIKWDGVAESTGATRDYVSEFIFSQGSSAYEMLDFHIVPTAVRATITTGALNQANFDANLQAAVNATNLGANQAVLFDPNGGDLNVAGHIYLIVDANGQAGYQAGADYVVQFTSYYGTLTLANFI